ncbi:MAG: gas vesicle protein [Nitrososphaerales archaeon]
MSGNRFRLPERPQIEQRPVANLLELLDRILDKGVVIIGDVKISVADIELLKIQIRLLIASVDKAKELGIDFSWARGIDSTTPRRTLSGRRTSTASQRQIR